MHINQQRTGTAKLGQGQGQGQAEEGREWESVESVRGGGESSLQPVSQSNVVSPIVVV